MVGCSSRETILSIEPVVAAPAWRALPLAFCLRLAGSGRGPIRFVDGSNCRRERRAAEHVAVAERAGGADQRKTAYCHQQGQASPAHARNVILIPSSA